MPERLSEEREAFRAWYDKLTAARRAEVEAEIEIAIEVDMTGPPHVRYLLAAIDTERQAHAETRAEVERLRARIADIGRNLKWPEPEKAASQELAAGRGQHHRDQAR